MASTVRLAARITGAVVAVVALSPSMRAMVRVWMALKERDPPTLRLPAPLPLALAATATATVGTDDSMRVVLVARTVRVPLTVIALLSTLASTPLGLAASPIVLVAALMPIAAPIATL